MCRRLVNGVAKKELENIFKKLANKKNVLALNEKKTNIHWTERNEKNQITENITCSAEKIDGFKGKRRENGGVM